MGRDTGDHPQEEVTKFGCIEKESRKELRIMPSGTYCLYMVPSLKKQIPQYLTTLVHLFHKNPLNELHWNFFFFLLPSGKNCPKKQIIIFFCLRANGIEVF